MNKRGNVLCFCYAHKRHAHHLLVLMIYQFKCLTDSLKYYFFKYHASVAVCLLACLISRLAFFLSLSSDEAS